MIVVQEGRKKVCRRTVRQRLKFAWRGLHELPALRTTKEANSFGGKRIDGEGENQRPLVPKEEHK